MTYPSKLSSGDEVRIIAPSRSLKIISEDVCSIANQRFAKLGLTLSFGRHVNEIDEFDSSSVSSRIDDLHKAFEDPKVKAIITAIGGFNSNQLLDSIDWDLIRRHPKIFCGFSDIAVLCNAILAKTGLVTYSGPHYSTFGQKKYFDYTLKNFIKATMSKEEYSIMPSDSWSDDLWFKDQDSRELIKNPGFLVINEGECEGRIIGGNISALTSLKGTDYFPDMEDSILFLEDDEEVLSHHFDRLLCSLIQLPGFDGVKGIVIGRFQKFSEMSREKLKTIIKTKKELLGIPVLVNVDFGHTDPKVTFPVGGTAKLIATADEPSSVIIKRH